MLLAPNPATKGYFSSTKFDPNDRSDAPGNFQLVVQSEGGQAGLQVLSGGFEVPSAIPCSRVRYSWDQHEHAEYAEYTRKP